MEALAEHMRAESHTVSAIHGEQPPEEQKRIMKVCSCAKVNFIVHETLFPALIATAVATSYAVILPTTSHTETTYIYSSRSWVAKQSVQMA